MAKLFLSQYVSIDGDGFSISRQNFKMAARHFAA